MRKQPLIPKPKVKKPSKATLSNRADKLAMQACHARGHCEAVGWIQNKGFNHSCGGRLEWAHIKSRARKNIRWEPWNCIALCHCCHRFFTQHPDLWTAFINDYDPNRWEYLNRRLRDGDKPDAEYWIQFYKEGHDIDHRRSPAVFDAT